MNLGITLKMAEKKLGPALPGPDREDNTLAALRYAAGKGKKFAGVLGLRPEAEFYIHFPVSVDWTLLTSKKGTPDFINDLKESGPQGEQGRESKVAQFLARYAEQKEKLLQKSKAAEEKKRKAAESARYAAARERLAHLEGIHEATLTIGSETVVVQLKITRDKKGKIKIAGSI